ALACRDGSVHLCPGDVLPAEISKPLRAKDPKPYGAVGFSGDGRKVFALSDSSDLDLWDVASRNHVVHCEAPRGGYRASAALSATGEKVYLCVGNGHLVVRDLPGRTETMPGRQPLLPVRSLALSSDGATVFTGSMQELPSPHVRQTLVGA